MDAFIPVLYIKHLHALSLYFKIKSERITGTDMEERSDGLYFGGLSADELADRYSTPLYVYEEKTLRERAGQLKKAITYPKTEIKYACKANTNRTIMRIFREEGLAGVF